MRLKTAQMSALVSPLLRGKYYRRIRNGCKGEVYDLESCRLISIEALSAVSSEIAYITLFGSTVPVLGPNPFIGAGDIIVRMVESAAS